MVQTGTTLAEGQVVHVFGRCGLGEGGGNRQKMDQAPALHFRCMVFLLLKKQAKLNLLVVGCLCQEFLAMISRDESFIHSGTSATARTAFSNAESVFHTVHSSWCAAHF
jgi:hypothetical protein